MAGLFRLARTRLHRESALYALTHCYIEVRMDRTENQAFADGRKARIVIVSPTMPSIAMRIVTLLRAGLLPGAAASTTS